MKQNINSNLKSPLLLIMNYKQKRRLRNYFRFNRNINNRRQREAFNTTYGTNATDNSSLYSAMSSVRNQLEIQSKIRIQQAKEAKRQLAQQRKMLRESKEKPATRERRLRKAANAKLRRVSGREITQIIKDLQTGMPISFQPLDIQLPGNPFSGIRELIIRLANTNRRYVIKFPNGNYYFLTGERITRLLKLLEKEIASDVVLSDSEQELVDTIINNGFIEITEFKKRLSQQFLFVDNEETKEENTVLQEEKTDDPLPSRRGPKRGATKIRSGFFKYFYDKKFIHLKSALRRYDMYFDFNKLNYDDNCLIKAIDNFTHTDTKGLIKEWSHFNTDEARILCQSGFISQANLNRVAKWLKVNLIIKRSASSNCWRYYPLGEYDSKNRKWKNENPVIALRSEEEHYFLADDGPDDVRLDITSYAINHYAEIKFIPEWWKIWGYNNRDRTYRKCNNADNRKLTIFQFYQECKKNGYLRPIIEMEKIYETQYHTQADMKLSNFKFKELAYNAQTNIQRTLQKEKKAKTRKIIFFDFETDTQGLILSAEQKSKIINDKERAIRTHDGIHRDYMCCAEFDTGEKRTFVDNKNFKWTGRNLLWWITQVMNNNYNSKAYKGKNKVNEGTADEEVVEAFQVILVAHNCNYDIKYILKWLSHYTEIVVGTSLKTATGTFRVPGCDMPIMVKIIDSYNFIPFGLAKFGSNLQIKCEKDVMPYHAYTIKNLNYHQHQEKPELALYKILETWDDELSEKKMKEKRAVFINNLLKTKMISKSIIKLNGKNLPIITPYSMVDLLGYGEYYCKLDVSVLKQGFMKYQQLMEEAVGEKCIDYLGLPSMANGYCEQRGVFTDVLKLAGVPQWFCQKSLVGGRCMTRNNCKWLVDGSTGVGQIADYDCTSEYPSACERIGLECGGFLRGLPQKITSAEQFERMKDCITTEQTNRPILEWEEKMNEYDQTDDKCLVDKPFEYEPININWSGYFVEIKVLKVNKARFMPLESFKNEASIRDFTNDLEYAYRVMNNEKQTTIFLNRFTFEDLVKYQAIQYEFVQGYYFNYGRNDCITQAIRHLFDERAVYKKVVFHFTENFEVLHKFANKREALAFFNSAHQTEYSELEKVKLLNNEKLIEKDPKEACFKLIMNIIYGRSSMKAPEFEISYVDMDSNSDNPFEKVDNYIERNYNSLVSYTKINDCNRVKFKKIKELNTHFNRVHIASEILGMSKRIMNEVITTAEDLDIPVFITDTDSMHLPINRIPELEAEFDNRYGLLRQNIYGRTLGLNGKDLGQFHTDFDLPGCRDVAARTSVFLWKKSYYDELVGTDNKTNELKIGEHARMKGITNVMLEVDKTTPTPCKNLYLHHYEADDNLDIEEKYRIFDLLGTKRPKFQNGGDCTMKTMVRFERSIRFNHIKKGSLNDIPKKNYVV